MTLRGDINLFGPNRRMVESHTPIDKETCSAAREFGSSLSYWLAKSAAK
ncbi:hypothetical protein [Ottowia thiooxydans]|uniref:Uncharacterized protein n=1 Tax=Ottowia thiooxydans TaxID=219182 RepID=A0ABV2QDW8_9BURK